MLCGFTIAVYFPFAIPTAGWAIGRPIGHDAQSVRHLVGGRGCGLSRIDQRPMPCHG